MEFKWEVGDIQGGVLARRGTTIYMICYNVRTDGKNRYHLVDIVDAAILSSCTKEELADHLNRIGTNGKAAIPIYYIKTISDFINEDTVN